MAQDNNPISPDNFLPPEKWATRILETIVDTEPVAIIYESESEQPDLEEISFEQFLRSLIYDASPEGKAEMKAFFWEALGAEDGEIYPPPVNSSDVEHLLDMLQLIKDKKKPQGDDFTRAQATLASLVKNEELEAELYTSSNIKITGATVPKPWENLENAEPLSPDDDPMKQAKELALNKGLDRIMNCYRALSNIQEQLPGLKQATLNTSRIPPQDR